MITLEQLKMHLRTDHDFDDLIIETYKQWAQEEVKDSVSTSETRNEGYFEENSHFDRAVVLLTAHYYENRLPMSDIVIRELPFGVASAIQKLRGGYYEAE